MRLTTSRILALCGVPTYYICEIAYRSSNGEPLLSIASDYWDSFSQTLMLTNKGHYALWVIGISLSIILLAMFMRIFMAKPLNVEKYMKEQHGIDMRAERRNRES